MFSDGYADQFGGDKQKKMTTKRFREFVLSIKNKSMKEQQIELENYFKFWQGNTEQVDDLFVIGIKLYNRLCFITLFSLLSMAFLFCIFVTNLY